MPNTEWWCIYSIPSHLKYTLFINADTNAQTHTHTHTHIDRRHRSHALACSTCPTVYTLISVSQSRSHVKLNIAWCPRIAHCLVHVSFSPVCPLARLYYVRVESRKRRWRSAVSKGWQLFKTNANPQPPSNHVPFTMNNIPKIHTNKRSTCTASILQPFLHKSHLNQSNNGNLYKNQTQINL